MGTMIQNRFRAPVTAFISPFCRGLLRAGVTPNGVTIFGAVGSSISAVYFFAKGSFFLGTLVVALFVLSDLLDGTMARMSKSGSTAWGAVIDSTLDRVTDAAIFFGIILYAYESSKYEVLWLGVVALVVGGLIPYIRAKAESLGINCSVGFAERAERLIIVLVSTGLYGVGFELALPLGLLILCVLGAVTVAQRLLVVARFES